ncbi:MAG: hypothetical protein HFF83_07500 [Oscillibacter sp.]|nr:hypothetical protein [Oscillibacter sp.]
MNKTRRLWRGLKHASPTILTCMAVVGVIGTVVLAVKGTTKAQKLVQEVTDEKGAELTKLETVKAAAPAYIPTALAGFSTVSCIMGANMLNKRQQASMTSAYAMLSQTYQRYRKSAKNVYGEEADSRIQAEMAKGVYIHGDGLIYDPDKDRNHDKILFFESNSQRYFEATIPAVLNAMYHLNRNLVLRGDVTLNEFLGFIGIDKIPDGDTIGWSCDELMESGLMWLDFENIYTKMEDGMECCIISSCISATPFSEDIPF